MNRKKHFDGAFYRRVIAVTVPIIIQNGITNFVNLLDNVMVGQVGTVPMSGVSIVNSLIFIFNLCIFGASSGAGIFTAQFYGSHDYEGMRHTMRYKLLACLLLTVGWTLLFLGKGAELIGLYLTGQGDGAMAEGAVYYGLQYLHIMLWGFLAFGITNAYASTLRESGETLIPMIAGVVAVVTNLGLNYVLIFGHFGVPAMGVAGAAIGTVISRFAELAIVAFWAHRHSARFPFVSGLYRNFHIPRKLFTTITVKGMPLLVNEFLWATGIATLNQCYSTCGLDVVPALNISSTLINLGSVVYFALGNSAGIIMGQMLGANCGEAEARSANRRMTRLAILAGALFGGLMMAVSGAFPQIYNTSEEIRHLAGTLICVSAAMMPVNSFLHVTYFTLRSGGQTFVTFLFDSCFMWVVAIPVAFCLSRFTALPIIPLFILCQGADILKVFLGIFMLKQGKWIQNLTTA